MRIDLARRLRIAAALVLFSAIVASSVPSAFAQTITGTISGTVTGQENMKLAGVAVTAVAPGGRYSATTDQNGFFSINGVAPDTYAVTFTIAGYETYTLQGITVVQGQIANVGSSLNKSLVRIGRTQSRSTGGAFQPTQTTDQYNVGTQQIQTMLGKSGAANEALLLASIPGASFDVNGFPVLRGGRETEEGFQFEGIDFTDAFTHQFVNSLVLNGAGNFQVTPGAGDASIGNVGTGAINIVAKRGTSPAFGQLEGDLRAGRYEHQLRGEYGWASPNGRFSNYASTFFDRNAYNYGGSGADPLLIGVYFTGRSNDRANDVLNNFVYKFGRDNSQSLQLFYDNTQVDFRFGVGVPPTGLPYKDNDAQWLANGQANLGIASPFIQALMPFTYGQNSLTDRIGVGSDRKPINGNQPNETFKLQYSNSLNSSTFLTTKFYRVNSVELFDSPYNQNGVVNGDFSGLQGGQRTGVALDGTKQLGAKNLLGFGGKYEYLTPIFSAPSSTNAAFTFGGFANSIETADFLSAANCPYAGFGLANNVATGSPCGYLLSQGFAPYRIPGNSLNLATGLNTGAPLPLALQLPYADNSTHTPRQDFAFYLKDTFTPTDRLKLDVGLRMDAVNWRSPACDIQWCLPTSFTTSAAGNTYQFDYAKDTRTPRVWQPRAAISFQATKNDALRFSYGRSVQFAPIAAVDTTSPDVRQTWGQFIGIPSRDSTTGTTAMFCGTSAFLGLGIQDQPCKNYAEQLRWENQAFNAGVPIQPLLPTTFNNFDFSYSHMFPHQVSVKLTPFYSKSFNQVAATSNPIVSNGQPLLVNGAPVLGPQIQTNLGKNQVTGLEFFLTKEAAYGLSGSLSLTYQNEFSNVVPTSGSEDFFPSIPPASLQLGNLYRVGFLSPFVGSVALQERTRSGWRINPVLFYNRGFPISPGLITATTIGGKPFNVPNTNLTNSAQLGAAAGADRYVDPRNPGSLFAPNIDATRGTPDANSAGGILSSARITAQLTVEYSSPRNPRSTFGMLVSNLFNQLYAQAPAFNTRFQPVATGIGGPYSGYISTATNPAFFGVRNFTGVVNGNQPYLIQPNNNPRTVDFYYQFNL
jgi:hypothetical protein